MEKRMNGEKIGKGGIGRKIIDYRGAVERDRPPLIALMVMVMVVAKALGPQETRPSRSIGGVFRHYPLVEWKLDLAPKPPLSLPWKELWWLKMNLDDDLDDD